jgi:hypothetical protein
MSEKDPTILSKEFALQDLKAAQIDPKSDAGVEYLLRVAVFGINGVQPPRPELNNTSKTQE